MMTYDDTLALGRRALAPLVNSKCELNTMTRDLAIVGRDQGIFTGVAAAAMAILPVLIAYIVFQRWIIRGLATTGTRG